MQKFILWAVAFCAFFIFAYEWFPHNKESFAQEYVQIDSVYLDKRPKVTIEGAEFYSGDFWADFINVVVDDGLWNEDKPLWKYKPEIHFQRMLEMYANGSWDLNNQTNREEYARLKENIPYLADYIYRPDGWPRSGVVNKWGEEISFGVGWPSSPFSKFIPNFSLLSQYYDEIKSEVDKNSSGIEKITRLPVSFEERSDIYDKASSLEFNSNYAKIRIIPVDHIDGRSWLSGSDMKGIGDYEPLMWGGVLFETSDRLLMDGYILPNVDNTIGLAVCRINVKNVKDEKLFRALVRECIVRSLGLPDISELSGGAVINDWRYSRSTDIKTGTRHISIIPPDVSSLDKAFLSVLYCPDIKPGMDKNDLLKLFPKMKHCTQ